MEQEVAVQFEQAREVLASRVRDIHDFPKPGVVFKDVTPLLLDHVSFSTAVDALVMHFGRGTVDKVVGIEARGFILGAPLAYHFGAGFIPVRKAGKLPSVTRSKSYDLEYGSETLEIHEDSIDPGDRVVVVDDVLATGGTARAACELVEGLGAELVGLGFLIELGFLNGAERLEGRHHVSLLRY